MIVKNSSHKRLPEKRRKEKIKQRIHRFFAEHNTLENFVTQSIACSISIKINLPKVKDLALAEI